MAFFSESLQSAIQLIIQFDRDVYWVVWTSLKISIIASLIAALIAIPTGLFIALNQFPGKKAVKNLLNTLMAMPTVVIGLLFYGLLSRQGLLGNLGLLYTPTAVILGEVFLIVPIMTNLIRVAVQTADPRLMQTLQSLGADKFQQQVLVLKETRDAVLSAVVAGFGRAIGEVGAAMMLGGNIQGLTRTMTTTIALETSKGEFELALALGILLLLIALLVNFTLQYLQPD
ncbi:MAG: ABC transporter permease [Methylococcales bacterium]